MNKPTDFQLCMQCQTHLTRLSVTFHLDNAEITEPKYKRLSVLTHNDGHLDADFEAKGCAGIRETVCHILQLFIGILRPKAVQVLEKLFVIYYSCSSESEKNAASSAKRAPRTCTAGVIVLPLQNTQRDAEYAARCRILYVGVKPSSQAHSWANKFSISHCLSHYCREVYKNIVESA